MEEIRIKNNWSNWGGTVKCNPVKRFNPESREDIISIVAEARQNNKKVRVAGRGYSWSPLVATDDYLIFVNKLNRISINKDKTLVSVETGATIDEVAEFFIQNNVCIPSNVVAGMGDGQYGGIIAAGCHGSGIEAGCVSDWVETFEVITADGECRTFSVEKDGEKVMNALRISLGMFGVIYSMTLRVQPMFNVEVSESKVPLPAVLDNLKNLVIGNDYLQMWYNPFNDRLLVHRANRTNKEVTRNSFGNPIVNKFWKSLEQEANRLALNMLETDPALTPDMVRSSFAMARTYDYVANIVHYTHNTDYSYILDRYKIVDIEILYELDPEMDAVRKAFAILNKKVKQWSKLGKFPLNVASCFRFIKSSECTLSPAHGNSHTGLVEIYANYKTDGFVEFAGEVATKWLDNLPKARPHWAKAFQFMPDAVPIIKRVYKPQIAEFLEVKESTGVDPDNMFVNGCLEKIFDGV